ncbi:MAG: GIY-YIG nuclease family protein [Thermoanaerobaculia bacterium]
MDKRAAKREYKEAKIAAGIYRVYNTTEDRSLVGSSVNVNAILNRHRAGLRMGAHKNKELQRDWNRLGETAFAFEVLDTLTSDDELGFDFKRELSTLEQLWLERLEPYGERGYNRPPK